MKIIDTTIDMAGKYRTRVEDDFGNVFMFKFDHEPTHDEIQTEYTKQETAIDIANDPNVQVAKIDDQIENLEALKEDILN